MSRRQSFKMFFFIFIGVVLITAASYFLQPAWKEWNNFDTMHGFYEEPENTIETVFLGASIVVNGITPMELYEDYGLCVYNLATEEQPVLASYYWIEEAERLHGDTLKTVILDTSMLRRTPAISRYRKALDGMRFSNVKIRAVTDCTTGFSEMVSYLFPLFSYHSRWSSLSQTDFEKESYKAVRYVRGYNFATSRMLDSMEYNESCVPSYYADNETQDTKFNNESLYYLKKMMEYCSEHNLELVLMKTPGIGVWSEADHNAVEDIADTYNLPFFDFNYEPYIDEVDYVEPLDSVDGNHMSYYGAQKLTRWFGEYLSNECQGTDVRNDESYQFMEEELEEYYEYVTAVLNLKNSKTVAEYLQQISQNPDYVSFITVKDEASNSLISEQRVVLDELGLTELASLEYRDSYIGILDGDTVIYEQIDRETDHEDSQAEQAVSENDMTNLTLDKEIETKESLEIAYTHELEDGTNITLKSGGCFLGNISSCQIDQAEYSPNGRGINLVVYDKKNKRVVDATTFDTYASAERDMWNLEAELEDAEKSNMPFEELSENLQKLVLYKERCEAQKQMRKLQVSLEDEDFLTFLDVYKNRGNTILYLSVAGDASNGMDEDVRDLLRSEQLEELADLSYEDSYVGMISDGEVIFEDRSKAGQKVIRKGNGYTVSSVGGSDGSQSSIVVNKKEYSPNQAGINVVVYDTDLELVIGSMSFDTGQKTVAASINYELEE